MKTLVCDCNRTMPLDAAALRQALGPDAGPEVVHSTLCRREAGAFQRAAKGGDDLLVACTQESRLFLELAAETEGAPPLTERPIRFVNIRESAGWSADARGATPKIAALIAAAQLPEPEPVPVVSYRSGGRVLVIGSAARAVAAARLLGDGLDITLLLTAPGGVLPQERAFVVQSGRLVQLSGWLGAFEASWERSNPIDLDLCTRCNACIEACPEQAIGFDYQVDLARCRSHRDCVRVCEAAGAIDFERPADRISETFDLVLDLGAQPAIDWHQPPQGYFHAADDTALVDAVLELRDAVGEFEKPKFFQYRQKLCAHSRNERIGCTACIDVCSAHAISSDASMKGRTTGGGILVEPHLCVGCGACTTVCPSGALTYQAPRPEELGRRVRTLLATHAKAGGRDAALLVHSPGAGARALRALGRAARVTGSVADTERVRGLPARVLPVEAWHTASVGIDLWLAVIAFGAGQVWVLMTDEEAPDYRRAVSEQMAVAEAALQGLGYAGEHFRIVDAAGVAVDPAAEQARGPASPSGPPVGERSPGRTSGGRDELPRRVDPALVRLDRALQVPAATGVRRAAAFAVQADKRATLDLALDHLVQQAPSAVPEAIALPSAGSPWGSLAIDTAACTLCLACVGACPEAALADNPDRPQLRFIEKNCVQCGLCVGTCPEHALALEPRLWLADAGKARRQPRVLNETEPFACVRCGKPFGTLRAVELMVAKLGGHSMFQGRAAERLKMCGDCRVIDLHTDPEEVRITDLRP
jgi:ferredoxin